MRRTADDAVISLEDLETFREAGGQFSSADNNLRDRRMAENLIWLATPYSCCCRHVAIMTATSSQYLIVSHYPSVLVRR